MSFVLDNSVAMMWLLPASNLTGGEQAARALDQLQQAGAVVPGLWPLEAANVITKSQRLGKITQAQASAFVALLDAMPIEIDDQTAVRALHDTLDLARQFGLSAYDAAYLELALRRRLPLATLDVALQQAASDAGVVLL